MQYYLKKAVTIVGLAIALVLTGCGDDQNSNQNHINHIKVGVIAGAEAQVAEVAVKIAKEKYNLDVELVIFTDYVTPNAALADGVIDANAFQHQLYLDGQMRDRGYQLQSVGKTFVYPIAAYSEKVQDISELKNGDRIALPNDPTNLSRSLLLIEKQGLIKLKTNIGLEATVLDIVENPLNLEFIELEAPQLPRSLDDVTLAIINTTYASSANLTPTKDGIFVEDSDSPYTNLIVTREDNATDVNVQNFIKAYQTEEVYQKANQLFSGGAVQGW